MRGSAREYLYILAMKRTPPKIVGYTFDHDHGIMDYDLEHGYAWVIRHYDPVEGLAIYDLIMFKPLARYVAVDVSEVNVRDAYKKMISGIKASLHRRQGYFNSEAVAKIVLERLYRTHPDLHDRVSRGW